MKGQTKLEKREFDQRICLANLLQLCKGIPSDSQLMSKRDGQMERERGGLREGGRKVERVGIKWVGREIGREIKERDGGEKERKI